MALIQLEANPNSVTSGTGLGPKTIVVSVTDAVDNVSNTEIESIANWLARETATGTAFTIAGISGDLAGGTQVVHLALQGTGALDAANADLGLANITVAEVCSFDG